MSNEEFDNLKEELMWEGSSVVMLSMNCSSQLSFLGYMFILSIGEFVTLMVFAVFLWCISGSDEQKFLEASMAYVSENPIMSDKEYDELKMKLKVSAWLFSRLCIIFNLQEHTHAFLI